MAGPSFQQVIQRLHEYWAARGCLLVHPYHTEVGAGTFNPATLLRSLGPEPWRAAYVEPSIRPTDGRYGENPFRLQHYFQYQVLLKPVAGRRAGAVPGLAAAPSASTRRSTTCASWRTTGRARRSAPGGSAGRSGWTGWRSPSSPTSSRPGGIDLRPISVELTYGLERIAMYLQGVRSVYDLEFGAGVTYGEIYRENERQWSAYNFEVADTEMLFRHFDDHERECGRCLDAGLVLPAYDQVLKCSHAFNLLDARGVISVTERGQLHLAGPRAGRARRPGLAGGADRRGDLAGGRLVAASARRARALPDLLLEVGCEELPSSACREILEQAGALFAEGLGHAGFAGDWAVQTWVAPRRFARLRRACPRRTGWCAPAVRGPARRRARAGGSRASRGPRG